jgi:beta-glucanase (GH16 family)
MSVTKAQQPGFMWQIVDNGPFGTAIMWWVYIDGDEFNGTNLDDGKWINCYPWGRNYTGPSYYQEYMTDGGNFEFGYNTDINSGTLRLVAKHEDMIAKGIPYEDYFYPLGDGSYNYQIWHYTSGMIFSKYKYKYGLFEINAKWPSGQGFFPAFWLFGGNPDEEIDIIEYKGETPNKYHVDVHCPNGCENYYNFLWSHTDFGGWLDLSGNLSESFNIIRTEWTPAYCIFSLNNTEGPIWLGDLNYQENIIANLSIAGSNVPFGSGPDNSTTFPSKLEIDYIRVWTRLYCDQDITFNSYTQSSTDPTAMTGHTINISDMDLSSDKTLRIIATDCVTIGPNSLIEGDFDARAIECPVIEKCLSNENGTVQILKNVPQIDTTVNNKEKVVLYARIFPNPTHGKIRIEFEGKIDRGIKIELFDAKGKMVFSREIKTLDSIEIDISNFAKGTYLLKGYFGENSITNKVIIN